jgi:hypothetical protein
MNSQKTVSTCVIRSAAIDFGGTFGGPVRLPKLTMGTTNLLLLQL